MNIRPFLCCLLMGLVMLTPSSRPQAQTTAIRIRTGFTDLHCLCIQADFPPENRDCSDMEELFGTYMDAVPDIPYVKLNSRITLRLPCFSPTQVEVTDFLLKPTGEIKYGAVESFAVEIIDGRGSFDLQLCPAAMFSSNLGDYLEGRSYRGFLVSWQAENQLFQAVFVLRTNAASFPVTFA